MPTYEYKCNICGERFEGIRSVSDRHNQKHCGVIANLIISPSQGKPVVKGYYSENLDAYITGPKQKERIMKQRGVVEVGTDKSWK